MSDLKKVYGTREVGVETIIPSIYRAYKENYSIYFYKKNGEKFVLYGEDINYIDLEKEVHTNVEAAIEHIKDLLDKQGLYERLQAITFTEKLGEYYMEDVLSESQASDLNKIKKRVIVYQATDDSI